MNYISVNLSAYRINYNRHLSHFMYSSNMTRYISLGLSYIQNGPPFWERKKMIFTQRNHNFDSF